MTVRFPGRRNSQRTHKMALQARGRSVANRHFACQSLRCSWVREMGNETEPRSRSKPRNLRETTEDSCGYQLECSKRGVGGFSLELSCSASSQS